MIVDRCHAINCEERCLDLIQLHLLWSCLHKDAKAVLDYGDGGKHHDYREDEGADWIGYACLGVVVDHRSSDNNANALDDVAYQESGNIRESVAYL